MTGTELLFFLEGNKNYKCFDDEESQQLLFRNIGLPWYRENQGNHTAITYSKMDNMDVDDLQHAINTGLDIRHVARVTGYFSVIEQWNPGKRAELRDRRRTDLYGNPPHISISDITELQAMAATA